MNKIIITLLLVCGFATSGWALPLTYTFSDKDILSGTTWGKMTISVYEQDTLMVKYEASTVPAIPVDSQVTGIAFTFIPSTTIPTSVTNPQDADYAVDNDSLTWGLKSDLSSLPNPANRDEFLPAIITKDSFAVGVDETRNPQFNPPGIKPGEIDIFYLTFSGADFTLLSDLSQFVSLAGIRLQGLPDTINGGSLFLVGTEGGGGQQEVPEPGTILLLGGGLMGLAFLGRRRIGK